MEIYSEDWEWFLGKCKDGSCLRGKNITSSQFIYRARCHKSQICIKELETKTPPHPHLPHQKETHEAAMYTSSIKTWRQWKEEHPFIRFFVFPLAVKGTVKNDHTIITKKTLLKQKWLKKPLTHLMLLHFRVIIWGTGQRSTHRFCNQYVTWTRLLILLIFGD